MTKEELIELSDLNREDNVKYISSEAQGIAIALDSDIYTPTLCKLERAYICGRRKSENRIAELEKENAELKEKNKSYEELIDNGSTTLMKEKLKNYKQLSKAKEIIKNLSTLSIPVDYAKCPGPLQKIAEAEQFLKEVSE